MRKLVTIGFAFGLALAPVALSAQGGALGARRGGPGGAERAMNMAERVLAQRGELGLTAAQVSQLEQIRDRVKAQNQPLLEQLAAARPQLGRGQRPDMARPGLAMLRRHAARVSPERRAELRDTARARLQSRRDQIRQLTQDQRAELRQQHQERATELRTQAAQLRPVAKQLRENMAASRKEVESVLTSEQLARLQSLRGRGRGGAPPR